MTNEQAYVVLENCASLLDSGTRFFTEDHTKQFREAYELAMKALRKTERKTGKWIPCSERLPETHKAGNSFSGIFMESKPVLVYGVPEYESEYSFNVVTYCDDLNGKTYWSTEMDAVTINEVTAWMPLPEPWKRGTE